MFEKPCYQKLDEPMIVWAGLEFGEIVTAFAAGSGTALLTAFFVGFPGFLAGVGVWAGLVALFRALRRGGPGYVFARLYRYGFFEILPAGLRPRHLMPIPGGGRRARFRLSVVEGNEKSRDRKDVHAYFGR